FLVAGIVLGIDDLEILARRQLQAHALDTLLDHIGPADENGLGHLLFEDDLGGPQHALVLAIREGDTLALLPRSLHHRLHHHAGAEDEAVEAVLIGFEILDWPPRNAGIHGRL